MNDQQSADHVQRAAVIGCGTMGLGLVITLAVAGLKVRFVDATPEETRQAHERLKQRANRHHRAGLLTTGAVDRIATTEPSGDIATAVREADLVLEAVFERREIKQRALNACAAAAPPTAIIATNTSSLPIDELATVVSGPERFLGVHWFNPPEWTPGVEVIPSATTAPEVVERVMALLRGIGKRPAVVGSGAGFVANRLQFALFREALACVEEGLASPEAIDEVVRSTFGFRLPFYGLFQIADMAGLDVYADIFEILERGLGEDFHVPDGLRGVVDEGRLGTKSGTGFYSYSPEALDSLIEERDRRYAALSQLLDGLQPPAGEDDLESG